jgi:ligand-binding sensor domain-containing protein/DNA-binding CsgD family transcriptional regulator
MLRKTFQLLLFLILTLPALPGAGSVLQAQPGCRVTHYPRSVYNAGSQNWSLSMDGNGYLCSANTKGLMVYDGVSWQTYPLPSGSIVRSVSASADGRIYTGSNEDFGYWEKRSSGRMEYTSLVSLLKNPDLHNREIWKIVQHRGKVYFQGFSCLFVYDGRTLKSIPLPSSIVFLLKAGDRVFAHAIRGDLYELVDDTLVCRVKSPLLHETEVKTILPYRNGTFLVGTSSGGVFVMAGNELTPWQVPANALLKEFQINNGVVFGDHFVFGTIVSGLFITDSDGNVLNHLFTENGLQNNTVLSLCNDEDRSLWVGLDNGIDQVSFNHPVDKYPGNNEMLGTVYTAALKDHVLYIGTNRGIFTYRMDGRRAVYEGLLPNSQGQIWQLKTIDGTLFCGRTGTDIIEQGRIRQISPVNGGYMLQKIMTPAGEFLIQSTYTSLVIFKKSGNSWTYSHEVKGFIEPARFMEADHLGNIWVAHQMKGLYRLRLSESLDSVTEKEYFDERNGLPSPSGIKVFRIGNRVVFANGERLYTWDDLNRKIIPFTELNAALKEFAACTSIAAVNENTYWFTTHTEAALFTFRGNQPQMIYRFILRQYDLTLVDGYENIVPLTENLHLICLENGFALFDKEIAGSPDPVASGIVFRALTSRDASGNMLTPEMDKQEISLPFAYNSVTISFATRTDPCSRKLFQYRLEGADTTWSEWSDRPSATYERLPAGKYRFSVRSLTREGKLSPTRILSFEIRKPWYASLPAFIVYLLVISAAILASQARYRRRYEKRHKDLQRLDDERRELERQRAEQEIIKLQNENLQTQVSHKNMQLADSTMSIIRKNEVLIEIKNELEKQKEELGPRYPARYLQRLTSLIDRNISNDNDWEIFEALFDQAHENFFRRLKQSFPDLTQSDLKLCAYLKLNLASKEIAPLLNISIRGVEIRRYRLRKRLGLSPEENLAEFIMQY